MIRRMILAFAMSPTVVALASSPLFAQRDYPTQRVIAR